MTSPPKKKEMSNPIYEALRKAAEPSSGLFVLPLPTGAGKTYNCCRLIADELGKSQQERRKIVYVTDAKRQLDATVSDIHANLKKLKVRVKEGDIVRVYSQDEQWQKALTNEDIAAELEALTLPGSAPKFAKGRRGKSQQQGEFLLKEQPEYDALKRLYRNLRNYRSQALTDELIKDIRKCRRALTRRIGDLVFKPARKQFKSNDPQREALVANEVLKHYGALRHLFPELLFPEAAVIVLTSAKLHTTAAPRIVDAGVHPYWHKFKRTLIVVDESDRVKEAGMKRLFDCECGRREQFDFWKLGMFLCRHFEEVANMKNFPPTDEHGLKLRQIIDKMLTSLRQECRELRESINPQDRLSCVRLNDMKLNGNFIFYDEDHTFSSMEEENALYVENDEENRVSYLVRKQDRSESAMSLSRVANRMMRFLKNFVLIVDTYAKQYAEEENASRNSSEARVYTELADDLAFFHILKNMEVNEGNTEYHSALRELRGHVTFRNQTDERESDDKEVEEELSDKTSVYDRGICFIEVFSRYNDRYLCSVDYHEMRCLPENVLLDLIKRENRIILSSATADCATPVHNYDLSWLESKGCRPERIDESTLSSIEDYLKLNYAQPEVAITLHEESVDNGKEKLEAYLGCCDELKKCLDYIKKDSKKNPDATNANSAARLINAIGHYLNFCSNEKARAWLYFQPFSYVGQSSIGIDAMLAILSKARQRAFSDWEKPAKMAPDAAGGLIYEEMNVCFLSGEHFAEHLAELKRRLADNPGLKMFCFVCYQSGAVGENYLYETTASYREQHCLLAPNTADRKEERCNFDGVILDKPTNFVALDKPEDYLRACVALSVLGADNQILLPEKIKEQCTLLRRRHWVIQAPHDNTAKGEEIGLRRKLNTTAAYDSFCLRWAVQALGRITRSTVYNKSVYISIGRDMAGAMLRAVSPQVQTELMKEVMAYLSGELGQLKRADENIEFRNEEWRRERYIDTMIYKAHGRSDDDSDRDKTRKFVAEMREYVLCNPQFDNLSDIDERMQRFYVATEALRTMGLAPATDACVHMEAMMRLAPVRELFEREGYCTSWPAERAWVISPQVVQ